MKKGLSLLLAILLICSLTACSVKEAVQEKTREVLGDLAGSEAPTGGDGNTRSDSSAASPSGSGTTPSGEPRPIAGVADYWERIENEWYNEPNEGYVWTVSFDGTETLDVMGLATVSYTLKLSCSHVGKDMLGPYKGEMEMSYNANLDGMIELITITGGSVNYDADGWFKNDDFIMVTSGYESEKEESFQESFEQPSDLSAEEQALMSSYMDAFLGDIGSGSKDFELSKTPAAHWYDWDFRMTEGDMSGYISMTGIAYGTTSGSGSVDASGVYTEGSATGSFPLVGTFSERYSETIESPFPYIIRLYETGEAVFELYSANGGPVTVKFYGTIDKIPVEQTTVVKP